MSAALASRIATLIETVTEGQIGAATLAGGASLTALGLDSLAQLRLIDAIERAYGIETDLVDDGRRLDTVDDIATHLAAHGATP